MCFTVVLSSASTRSRRPTVIQGGHRNLALYMNSTHLSMLSMHPHYGKRQMQIDIVVSDLVCSICLSVVLSIASAPSSPPSSMANTETWPDVQTECIEDAVNQSALWHVTRPAECVGQEPSRRQHALQAPLSSRANTGIWP